MKKVPNMISLFRICLVPVFVVAYFGDQNHMKIYAALVYALAAVSDFLDGYIARKYKVDSNLGKVLDPLGDKMITVAAMTCITIDGLIEFWAVSVLVVKEILMGIGGLVLHKVAHAEIPSSNILGKASTVVFFLVCATLMLLGDIIPHGAVIALISLAIAVTFLALVSYVFKYSSVMKSREKKAKNKETKGTDV